MLHAITHGKVPREVRRLEDVLTANVFGVLDLLPAELGLGRWLRGAVNLAGATLDVSDDLLETRCPEFWPRESMVNGEVVVPDLVLECASVTLVIEAKYGAGPSGMPGDREGSLGGQLGRQWEAARHGRRGQDLHLLYLTADWSIPRKVMEDMIEEVEAQGDTTFRPNLYWLSWRSLYPLLEKASRPPNVEAADVGRGQQRLVAQLQRYVEQMDLEPFTGISRPTSVSVLSWRFLAT